jgi:hypothetical protein
MKKTTIIILALTCLNIFSFDYKQTFQESKKTFEENPVQTLAIKGFESIVKAYDLGEITGEEALNYSLKSMEYLVILYYTDANLPMVKQYFEKITKTAPYYKLNGAFIPPKIRKKFEAYKNSLVGYIELNCTAKEIEEGNEVTIPINNASLYANGVVVKQNDKGQYPLLAGDYEITVSKKNYSTYTTKVTVEAGKHIKLSAQLLREMVAIRLITQPAGVEVYLDSVLIGKTIGEIGRDYISENNDTITELGLNPSLMSDYFFINEVEPKTHMLELKKPCYKPIKITLNTVEKRDYRFKPFKLDRSIGYIEVVSGSFGQTGHVFIDGRSAGPLPVSGFEVCSGEHQVKVVFESGVFVKKINVAEGEKRMIKAVPKPTMLFAGIKGIDNNLSFVNKFKKDFILKLKNNKHFNLSYDKSFETAIPLLLKNNENVMTQIKNDYGQCLILLGVEKRIKLKRYIDFYIINTEIFYKEKFTVDPVNRETDEKLINALKNMPQLTEKCIGVNVIKDPFSGRLVVIDSVNPQIQVGDIIIQIDKKDIMTEKDFYSSLKFPTVAIQIKRDKIIDLNLSVDKKPIQIRQNLQSLSYNATYLYLLSKSNFSTSEEEKSSALLNLAICYLRFQEYEKAFDTLSLINLPDDYGVSAGTVLYLQGLCYQSIGSWTDLQILYKGYNKSDKATVINSRGFNIVDLIDFTFQYLSKK